MPTPSNLPRMSSEDEALMWDILDLTSSSSFTKPANTARLATYNEEMTTNEPDSPEQESDDEIPTTGRGQGPDNPNVLAQHHDLMEEAAQTGEEPSSDWPFSQRVGINALAAVPDIPDWMIFGDFTEHL